jgi:hypothetical protein
MAVAFAHDNPPDHITFLPMTVYGGLYDHPLVRAGVAFATRGGFTTSLIRMMSEIYDIRRFVDPKHPNRASRLRNYFRLTSPKYLRYDDDDYAPEGDGFRATTVAQSWMLPHLIMLPDDELKDPCLFLYREVAHWRGRLNKKLGRDESLRQGVWRASLRFLSFVYGLWRGAVTGSGFDPIRFFKSRQLAASYIKYINGFDKSLDT